MNTQLSILIPGIAKRVETHHPKILLPLRRQAKGKPVQILMLTDDQTQSIGSKENDLLRLARGKYVAFVGDDDEVSPVYVNALLEGIKSNADVINFLVSVSVNGEYRKDTKFSIHYEKDSEDDSYYYRLPNEVMCMKRELALLECHPDMNHGQDGVYSRAMKKHLKTEYNIEQTLYYYNWFSDVTETKHQLE